MKFQISCQVLLILFMTQLSYEETTNSSILKFQKNVESLIQKILQAMRDYYQTLKKESKCIPEDVPDKIVSIIKESVDCVENNEEKYVAGKIDKKQHRDNFFVCFNNGKDKVKEIIKNINPKVDYCPLKRTERTYNINVTTTFSKTFKIYIENGKDIFAKEINSNDDDFSDFGFDQQDNDEYEEENYNFDLNENYRRQAEEYGAYERKNRKSIFSLNNDYSEYFEKSRNSEEETKEEAPKKPKKETQRKSDGKHPKESGKTEKPKHGQRSMKHDEGDFRRKFTSHAMKTLTSVEDTIPDNLHISRLDHI